MVFIPDTECPECRLAEMTSLQRAEYRLYLWWIGGDYMTKYMPTSVFSSTISAMLGQSPKTWYDKHRDLFVETGDPREYTRMLRHII